MTQGKFKISEEQKQQLIQAIVTLLTVLVSIALTLATQAVSDWIDRPDPVDTGETEIGEPVDVSAPFAWLMGRQGEGVKGRVSVAACVAG